MNTKEGKVVIGVGIGLIILAIAMFGLSYNMATGENYEEVTLVGNLGTAFFILGIIVMIIGEIIIKKAKA